MTYDLQIISEVYDLYIIKKRIPANIRKRKVGVQMRQHIYDTWTLIMDSDRSPLKNISDNNARHLILQILAWMWCIVFSIFLGSYLVFGLTAIAHVLLLAAIAITVGTFDTANRNPKMLSDFARRVDGYNGRRNNGEHD